MRRRSTFKKALAIAVFLTLSLNISFAQIPSAVKFNSNLYFGLRNNSDVYKLQQFLIENKYLFAAQPTGNFYSQTLQALKSYQRAVGVPATGFFGPITRAKINAAIELKSSIEAISEKIRVVESQKPIPAPVPASQPPLPVPPAFSGSLSPPPAPVPTSPENYRLDPKPDYNLSNLRMLVHQGINNERIKNGFSPLAEDLAVAETARKHSADQAEDNAVLTIPGLKCHYAIIRHEGIRGGYALKDRLQADNISYQIAGENIVMFSSARDLIYRYSTSSVPPPCPEVASFPLSEGPKEERLKLYEEVLDASRKAVNGLSPVNWVNRKYLTEAEIAAKAVELWMNSPGHRTNILRPEFSYAGIGIVPVNDYFIITQNFLGR